MSKPTPPRGFRYTVPTPAELAEWRAAHPNRSDGLHALPYRLVCLTCDRRLWGSGLGVGSHRRACKKGRA